MTPHGHFNWNELRTRNAERAMKFYKETIGWTFEGSKTPDGLTYWVAQMNGQPVAGLFPLDSPRFDGVPESWMCSSRAVQASAGSRRSPDPYAVISRLPPTPGARLAALGVG